MDMLLQELSRQADLGGSTGAIENERVIEDARANGCNVIIPEHGDLILDLDTDEQYAQFKERLGTLNRAWDYVFKIARVSASNSGLPHRHVELNSKYEFEDAERIALQLYLGSDPTKEMLSIMRCYCGIDHPTFLIRGGNWKGASND